MRMICPWSCEPVAHRAGVGAIIANAGNTLKRGFI
jgi:hypothetical protein